MSDQRLHRFRQSREEFPLEGTKGDRATVAVVLLRIHLDGDPAGFATAPRGRRIRSSQPRCSQLRCSQPRCSQPHCDDGAVRALPWRHRVADRSFNRLTPVDRLQTLFPAAGMACQNFMMNLPLCDPISPLDRQLYVLDAPDAPSKRVLVSVCTYQEAQNIQPMVRRLRAALPNATVLVIDDDSPDGTAERVREVQADDERVHLIVRTDQRGLGSAIVLGMKHAIESGYDLFVNLDADLSHDPDQVPSLVEVAQQQTDVDVVIGSRYIDGGQIVGWPLRRRLMSKLVNRFATSFLNLPVHDCSGSMRCYRTRALAAIGLDRLQCTGYAVLEEVLVRLHQQGSKMVEVPITFTEREAGQSKLTLGEAMRSVRYMIRLAVSLKR